MAKEKDFDSELKQELEINKESISEMSKMAKYVFQDIEGIKTRFSKDSLAEDLPKTHFDLWDITDLVNAKNYLAELYQENSQTPIDKKSSIGKLKRRELFDIYMQMLRIKLTLEKKIFGTYKQPSKKEFSDLVNIQYDKYQKVFREKSKVVEFYYKEFGFTDNVWTLQQAKDYCKKY